MRHFVVRDLRRSRRSFFFAAFFATPSSLYLLAQADRPTSLQPPSSSVLSSTAPAPVPLQPSTAPGCFACVRRRPSRSVPRPATQRASFRLCVGPAPLLILRRLLTQHLLSRRLLCRHLPCWHLPCRRSPSHRRDRRLPSRRLLPSASSTPRRLLTTPTYYYVYLRLHRLLRSPSADVTLHRSPPVACAIRHIASPPSTSNYSLARIGCPIDCKKPNDGTRCATPTASRSFRRGAWRVSWARSCCLASPTISNDQSSRRFCNAQDRRVANLQKKYLRVFAATFRRTSLCTHATNMRARCARACSRGAQREHARAYLM